MLKNLSVLLVALVLGAGCTKTNRTDIKVLRVISDQKVKGMDPILTGDTYSSNEVARVYEGLLTYHYLKRPYTLIPNLAESLPEVSADGLTYTFKIKKGVKFHDNKCFKDGKGRELVAEDFVYSIKRLADSKLAALGWWLLDGKIVGLNEWRDKYASAPSTNYDEEIEGLKALDSHTLQFKLAQPFPQFLYSLAMPYTFAVPKEAVEFYGSEFLNNPVGTGAFITDTYTQSNKIIYTKNPNYHDVFYPTEGEAGDKEAGLLDSAGKKLPLVDRIEVSIITESQPAWLSFEKGKNEYYKIPKDNFETVLNEKRELSEPYVKKGIQLEVTPDLDVTYVAFNVEDPLFKGAKGLALRKAMALVYDQKRSNELFYGNSALPAQTIIPPGVGGFDENYRNPYQTNDIEKAKQYMIEAGYPDGKGLPALNYDTTATSDARQMAEFLAKQFSLIGIKLNINTNTWPELVKKTHSKQVQIFGMAWLADYPDAENFLQLLYGPNKAPGPNPSNFDDPKFNAMFEKATRMQDSPERTRLYKEMNQYVAEQVPMIYGVHRTNFSVRHGWLKNYKFTTFEHGTAKYLDIDLEKKEQLLKNL